jgi:hypothetical protein
MEGFRIPSANGTLLSIVKHQLTESISLTALFQRVVHTVELMSLSEKDFTEWESGDIRVSYAVRSFHLDQTPYLTVKNSFFRVDGCIKNSFNNQELQDSCANDGF